MESFDALRHPSVQPVVQRVHIPTAEFLARAIRAGVTADFEGPTWQARAFKDGMRTAAEFIDVIIAEARK